MSASALTASTAERATLFRALSDETRLAILGLLQRGEHCVCDLQVALDAAQSRLSFHLKVLRDAGLVEDRKEGRWSYYRLVPARFSEVAELATSFTRPAPRRARPGPTLHQLGRARPVRSGTAQARASSSHPEAAGGCCS